MVVVLVSELLVVQLHHALVKVAPLSSLLAILLFFELRAAITSMVATRSLLLTVASDCRVGIDEVIESRTRLGSHCTIELLLSATRVSVLTRSSIQATRSSSSLDVRLIRAGIVLLPRQHLFVHPTVLLSIPWMTTTSTMQLRTIVTPSLLLMTPHMTIIAEHLLACRRKW